MLVEPEEHREAPVDATQHTVLWQQQEKVFCRCGSVMWQPRRDYRHSKIERWELCS
jgi:CDGSH-type Zn-finger protein